MITPAFNLTATERVLPRLALDFTTAALDSRVTVTRALNTATRINSSGFVEVVNANLPRFDYTLNTGGVCKGLLIEETRANKLLYSSDFDNAVWLLAASGTGTLPIVTKDYGISPDGTQNADRIQLNAGAAGISSVAQTPGTFTSVPNTFSIFLKSLAGDVTVTLFCLSAVQNVTVTSTWQRFTFVRSISSSTPVDVRIAKRDVWSSPGAADLLVYGAQLEDGAFDTSYIPTTTTSLTRNADVVNMTGTNFSSWYTTAGNNESWFAQFISANIKSGDRIVAFDTGLVGASAYRTPLGNAFGQLEIYDGTGDRLFGTIPLTGVNKAATGYSGTTVSGTLNGAAITSRAYDGNMNPSATLGIGSYSGTASGFINGWMQKIAYYPQRLTDAELQAITK